MIKGVVFDLDDTLICEREYIFSGFKVVSRKIEKDYKLNSQNVFWDIIRFFNRSSRKVFNRLLDYYKLDYSQEYIEKLVTLYRNHIPSINLYNDAKYIIKHLYNKNIKLGIITDGYKATQKNKLKALNIGKYFECIIITDELGREYWKPSEVPYEIAKKELKLKYEEMVCVGDNIQKDFITANKLGMETACIIRSSGIYSKLNMAQEYSAKYTIKSLKELSSLNYKKY